MVWGATPLGTLPVEGGVANAQAAPRVEAHAFVGVHKLLQAHPSGVAAVRGGSSFSVFTASASAVDAVTVLMSVSPTLAEPVTFAVAGAGNPVVVGYVTQLDGSFLITVVGLIPQEEYSITAISGYDVVVVEFTALQAQAGQGYKILEAITYAYGKQIQDLAGQPSAKLTRDLGLFDTVAVVSSTLGFPPAGWLRIGSLVVEYTAKTTQSFTLLEPVVRYPIIAIGARITLMTDNLTPDGAGFGTESY